MDVKDRPSRDMVLMGTCDLWAARSTCSRAALGALLVWENRIISTGYNGAPKGMPHCDHKCNCGYPGEGGLLFEGQHLSDCAAISQPGTKGCVVAVHAEANAIAFAARYGSRTEGTTMYCTLTPCVPCAQLIINAGVVEVVNMNAYRDPAGMELLEKAGVIVRLPIR